MPIISKITNFDTRNLKIHSKPQASLTVFILMILMIMALIGEVVFLLVRLLSNDAQLLPKPSSDGIKCYRKPRSGNTTICSGEFCYKLVFNNTVEHSVVLNCINGTDPAYDWNGKNETEIVDGMAYKCHTNFCNDSKISAPSMVILWSTIVIVLFHYLF